MKERFRYIKNNLNNSKAVKRAFLSTVLVVCMFVQSMAGFGSLRQEDGAVPVGNFTETAETIQVKNKENLAVIANSPEDKRTPFTILEVVPSEVCSVFPYMIDWGDKESYDANVPIGYDGVVKMVNTLGGRIHAATDEKKDAWNSWFYTYTYRGIKEETLEDYKVNFASSENDQSGNWYRAHEPDSENDRTESGYFLRVPSGKGLYSLSFPDMDIEVLTPGMGKGAYDLIEEEFVAYMLKEDAEKLVNQPSNLNNKRDLYGMTDVNYTLAFHRQGDNSGFTDDYNYSVKDGLGSPKPNEQGDYALDAKYVAKGAYQVNREADAVEKADNGLYVREDSPNDDGYRNDELGITEAGYFRLYNKDTDSNKQRYKVMFVSNTTTGTYPEQFVYAGEKKGNFDVWFEYTGKGTGTYAAEKLAVELNKGEYVAVTKTELAPGQPDIEVPQYVDIKQGETGDYDLAVRSIPSKAVGEAGAGKLNWVWVAVEDESKMETTLRNELKKNLNGSTNSLKEGTRIYMKKYTRKYAYYCKYGFVNNEWFKLRCLFTDPADSTKPYPYETGKTCIYNLEKASSLLKSWDANNRIKIITVKPNEVTTAMVDQADLIYFSDKPGIEGINIEWEWLTGNPLPGSATSYTGDISFSVAERIYNKCIVNQDAALMMNRDLGYGIPYNISENMTKLYFMINGFEGNKKAFAEFLVSSGYYNNEFSAVFGDGYVKATYVSCNGERYYNPNTLFAGYEYISENYGTWKMEYFTVYNTREEDGILKPNGLNPAYKLTYNMSQYLNRPSDTYLVFDEWSPGWFRFPNMSHIWTILHNRNTPITLDVTNAALTGSGELVIYADELDEEIPVNYIVGSDRDGSASVTVKFSDAKGTEELMSGSVPFNAEQTVDVRKGFTNPYWSADKNTPLDPVIRKRKVIITAESNSGSTAQAEVWVIVRDMFTLN